MTDFLETLDDALRSRQCLRLTLSRRRKGAAESAEKVIVRPVRANDQVYYQFASRIGKQETHQNLLPEAAVERCRDLLGSVFLDCHLFTPEADYSARTESNGGLTVRRSRPTRQAVELEHNRSKRYLIPEGVPCRFLEALGVMTPQGKVRAARYDKFRQINRFLELVNDVLPALPAEGELQIVDFGCGKSYLTFALHHLLTVVAGRRVRLLGLDRERKVVQDCIRLAERLECDGLEFRVGDIAQCEEISRVHLAVSLHACDTATDQAIAKAVGWQADVILAVPCCQHELAPQLSNGSLDAMLKHGILRERVAAIATDTLRAQALDVLGYRTQIVEFIDLEHTPKNLLIRAVRRPPQDAGCQPEQRAAAAAAYRAFREKLGISTFALEKLLPIPPA